MTVHLDANLSPADEAALMSAAYELEDAAGAKLFSKVVRGGSGCGVYLAPGDDASMARKGRAGLWRVLAPCKCEVSIRPGVSAATKHVSALHELLHAVLDDGGHSEDAYSVRYHKLMDEQVLRDEDVRAIRGRL